MRSDPHAEHCIARQLADRQLGHVGRSAQGVGLSVGELTPDLFVADRHDRLGPHPSGPAGELSTEAVGDGLVVGRQFDDESHGEDTVVFGACCSTVAAMAVGARAGVEMGAKAPERCVCLRCPFGFEQLATVGDDLLFVVVDVARRQREDERSAVEGRGHPPRPHHDRSDRCRARFRTAVAAREDHQRESGHKRGEPRRPTRHRGRDREPGSPRPVSPPVGHAGHARSRESPRSPEGPAP